MNQRSIAISILQKARDALSERLTERIIESQSEIESDAEGASYLSEIETIYELLGGRLAHLNAMLSNLPPTSGPAPADAMASEIVYADLASAYSASFELEAAAPMNLLALPAPAPPEEESRADRFVDQFAAVLERVQAGDMPHGARLISELLDIKPSQARRGAQAFVRQLAAFPDLARRFLELGETLEAANEYTAATLLGECFEFQAIDALSIVRYLKLRRTETDHAH